MNVYTDKFNCYIEGIRIPFLGMELNITKNQLSKNIIKISAGGIIHPKMWANALIQISYLEQNYIGEKKEKLFFEGLVEAIEVVETAGYMTIYADSKWSALNINSTLDYVMLKKYGIGKIPSETKIYIGNEEVIEADNNDVERFNMSERYFFLPAAYQDNKEDIVDESSESFKLQYIVDRTPLAERIAYMFFDQIAYLNFFLTRAHVLRLNLLQKVSEESSRYIQSQEIVQRVRQDTQFLLGLDIKRSGLAFKMTIIDKKSIKTDGKTGTDVSVTFDNLPQDFLNAVNEMCGRLNTKSDWVLAVMNFETGGTFAADKRNPSSGATGLIQFMPSDAPGDVGKTTSELANMTRIEQLKYVEIYFSKKGRGRLTCLENVAMCVFYPVAIGNPDYKFPPNVVRQNNGISTPREYVNRVVLRLKK
jgi:hypothetical protein